jgi:YD repeat-containing protein
VNTCTVETDPSSRNLVYEYNSSSPAQLIGVKDPSGNTWTFAYDAHDNLTSITDPLSRITCPVSTFLDTWARK